MKQTCYFKKKQLTVIMANNKIQAFERKLEFWKTIFVIMNSTAFQDRIMYFNVTVKRIN